MITGLEFLDKFGLNSKEIEKNWMVLWDVPMELEIGAIPKRVYCNKLIIEPLTEAFKKLYLTGCVDELKTWDGCYNPRPIRGYEDQFAIALKERNFNKAAKYASTHYWGCAIDVNAAWNRLGKTPTLTPQFVKCFTDSNFDWGGNFTRLDGMHFQLASFSSL